MTTPNNGIKKIVVNLDSLQQRTPKKQTKKRSLIQPNKLKDAFMKQVQHYKSVANSQKSLNSPNPPTNAYTDDFNDSVAYLNNIKKSADNVHTELPVELSENIIPSIPVLVDKPMLVDNPILQNKPLLLQDKDTQLTFDNNSIPPVNNQYKVDNAIPYGCLKNGIKPSFKNWTRSNRTPISPQKQVQLQPQQQQQPVPQSQAELPQTEEKQQPTQPTIAPAPTIKPPQRTTIKRHVIGKRKNTRQVGVLIKNISTRKMIVGAHKDLKKVSINEVKSHLKNNGLLKVGTTAPTDILRQTYESSILAGNIVNKSGETLYHNFVNDTNN